MLFITRETMERGVYRVAVTDSDDNTTEWVDIEQVRQLLLRGVKVYGAELRDDGTLKYVCFQNLATVKKDIEVTAVSSRYNARYIARGLRPPYLIDKKIRCIGIHCKVDGSGKGYAGSVEIPDFVEILTNTGYSKEEQNKGYHLLSSVEYDSLVLPKTLQEIGYGVFRNSVIKSDLRIPDSVHLIRSGAFDGCKINGNLYLPRTISSKGLLIEDGAFEDCCVGRDLHLPGAFPPSIFEERNLVIEDRAFMRCEVGREILCDIGKSYPPRGNIQVRKNAWKGCKYFLCYDHVKKLYRI